MRFVLEDKLGKIRPPVTVFVSHTSFNKLSYAALLTAYLKRKGVANVFLDKYSIPVGSIADDEMMWAAVSCKYFWCVLTKEFVQSWYPMRELMVGYIRHITESGEKFTLLLDCLETGARPDGSWMERIFKIEALKLYKADAEHVKHPGNMQKAIGNENFDVGSLHNTRGQSHVQSTRFRFLADRTSSLKFTGSFRFQR